MSLLQWESPATSCLGALAATDEVSMSFCLIQGMKFVRVVCKRTVEDACPYNLGVSSVYRIGVDPYRT